MRIFKNLLPLCLLAALTACSEDALVPQSEFVPTAEGGSVDLVSMVVPDIVMDDATTRSRLIDDGSELKFVWQENDDIGVVPMSGRPLSFVIHAENAGKNTALFDGGGWALKTNEKYAAFFPLGAKNQKTDITRIAYSYIGQTQSNFPKYDFLVTGAVQPKDGAVKFTMKRLSAILKIRITMPAESYGRYGTLVASNAVFGVEGTLDLSGNEPIVNANYSKMIHTQIAADKTSSSEWMYEVIMMIPATDLSDESLMFRIISDQGQSWEAPLTGANFEAGKAYVLEGVAGEAKVRNKNLIHASVGQTSLVFVTDSEGNLCVNRSRAVIDKVTEIDVQGLEDPTVCDEIGYFRNLKTLDCSNNYDTPVEKMITSLDVSQNTALTSLVCYYNQLTSLDVSKNTALTTLDCGSNLINSLDVTQNTVLTRLECYGNNLKSLDISNNQALTYLNCGANPLKTLDVSNNLLLGKLYVYQTALSSIDVSSNLALKELNISSNRRITSLDVSNNTALSRLSCYVNKLSSLDVSNNTALTVLDCNDNQLTSLDVSNNTALVRLECNNNQLTSLNVSNNVALNTLNCSNNQLTTITGLNDCTNLVYLKCNENPFTSFSIAITSSSYTKLKEVEILNCKSLTNLAVYCTATPSVSSLTKLWMGGCTALTTLNCYGNKLTSLAVSTCTALTRLRCFKNQLSELDISKNTALTMANVQCGGQTTSSGSDRTITLTVNATQYADKDNLSSSNNSNVTVVQE